MESFRLCIQLFVFQRRDAGGADIFVPVGDNALCAVAKYAGGLEFLEHDGIIGNKDLQSVALSNVEIAAKLDGEYNAAQLINSSDNAC